MIINNIELNKLLELNKNYSRIIQQPSDVKKGIAKIFKFDIETNILLKLTDIQGTILNILNSIFKNKTLYFQSISENNKIIEEKGIWDKDMVWNCDIIEDQIYIMVLINKEHRRININQIFIK